MTTGKLIQAERIKSGLSVPAAAHRGGVSQRAWYQLEADENSPTVTTLQKIAGALGCKVSDLIPEPEKNLSAA